MSRAWRSGDLWHIDVRTDDRGSRSIEGPSAFCSADVHIGPAPPADVAATRMVLRPVVESPGASARLNPDQVIAVQMFNSAEERPLEQFAAFERRIIGQYYSFMRSARWHYAGLYELDAEDAFPFSRGEPYLIDAATIAEAKQLDESTSPEPPEILEIYAECSSYKSKSPPGDWLWLTPPRMR